MSISDELLIIDNRVTFKNNTFSNYKKTAVINTLLKSILEGRIEASCHWCAELHMSGYIDILFEILVILSSKIINIKNPKLPEYILGKYIEYKKIENKSGNSLSTRNNNQLRSELCELISVMTLSRKSSAYKLIKLSSTDFDFQNIKQKLSNVNVNLVKSKLKEEDPIELQLIASEIYNNLQTKMINNIIYWISWMCQWESISNKNKKKYECGYREIKMIDSKLKKDWIWLIWDIIINYPTSVDINHQILCLFKLFRINYSKSKKIYAFHF